MPKRIATPPPGDDEPRYLTVVHPFVPSGHCNMELPMDRQDFARWVACCIDKDAVYCFFHKPRARDMVIIEVARKYQHCDRILGEHRWSEFLKNPSDVEKDQVTRVYYCTYNTGRIVQKNGWKRVEIDEDWFKNYSPNNRQAIYSYDTLFIRFPYPTTHFCDIPVEDQTNHPLCRPLPGAVKAPPPESLAAPAPVVGSEEWTTEKKSSSSQSKATKGAWANGAPKASAKPIVNVRQTGPNTKQGPQARMPAVGGGPIVVKASNVWQRPLSPPSSETSNDWDGISASPILELPQVPIQSPPSAPPGLPPPAWKGASPTAPPGFAPPGLPPPKAWAASNQPTLPPLINTATSWDSSSGSGLGSSSSSDDPYKVHIQISDSMEEELFRMKLQGKAREFDEDSDVDELDSIAPATWSTRDSTSQSSFGGEDDAPRDYEPAWDDPDMDAESQYKKKDAKPVMLCKAHGLICKKGICAQYAEQLRDIRKAERAAEREAARGQGGKGRGGAKGAARGGRGGLGRGVGGPARGLSLPNRGSDRGRGGLSGNPPRGRGAVVKTNWRGAPREIVTAARIAEREGSSTHGESSVIGWENPENEWAETVEETKGDADARDGAKTPTQTPTSLPVDANAPSDAGWNVSEVSHDPWGGVTSSPKQPQLQPAPPKAPSNDGWNVSEVSHDPWGHPAKPEGNLASASPSSSRNALRDPSNDGWNVSEASYDPWEESAKQNGNPASTTPAVSDAPKAPSNDGWNVSQASFDPWESVPSKKSNPPANGFVQKQPSRGNFQKRFNSPSHFTPKGFKQPPNGVNAWNTPVAPAVVSAVTKPAPPKGFKQPPNSANAWNIPAALPAVNAAAKPATPKSLKQPPNSANAWNVEPVAPPVASAATQSVKKVKGTSLDKPMVGTWADEMDAASAAGYPDSTDGSSVISSKGGARAQSTTGGWGSVSDMPW
ncbi:hypothetical protein BJ138DRAFT_1239209 [Hygrophoropsis aurantiaca]|uniref:Uncharacterized protein n=1 Tax=Hygrophoropsis aurantiaca TaxID=72124 RepID=A0ACB8ADE1_9AGAM|nr:hypothetical protein BJ138DRAFT_1239209 [Hygrophoropsis aurantiaca]